MQPRPTRSTPSAAADITAIDERIDRIAQHPFRAKFRLRGRDRGLAELRGPATIRKHAHEIVAERLASAAPRKDGTQTPYRGHPVFVAQHATATCCRNCLERNHAIPKGHELTEDERAYVVAVVTRWIERELAAGGGPTTLSLWQSSP